MVHPQLACMTYYHVYSDYERTNHDATRRHHVARMTWGDRRIVNMPVHDKDLKRSSVDIGDTRRLPFIADMIDYAADRICANDVIVLTNEDICLCNGFIDVLESHMDMGVPVFCHRRDFADITKPLTPKEIEAGGLYPGFDLFAFTTTWWRDVKGDFPDLIMGLEWWDCVMWQIMKSSGGVEIKNVAYHEQHDATWCQPGFINTNPGQIYVRGVAAKWFEKHPSKDLYCVDGKWMTR